MIFAMANSKGGVGKSTLAVHLAVWLADRHKKVLLVDADHQESSSRWIEGIDTSVEFMTMHNHDEIIQKISACEKEYDFVVMDGPAGLDEITRAILGVADKAILPCGPSLLDIMAADQTVKLLQSTRILRKGAPDAVFVCNKMQARTVLTREMVGTLTKFPIPVASHGLHLRQVYADAVGQKSVVMRIVGAEKAAEEIDNLFAEVIGG